MKKTVVPTAEKATWSAQSLYDKAERYIQQCAGLNVDDWEYGLWSSLSLELLARAALANIHPALLAEPDRSGSNLMSSLGFEPVEASFSPKSISTSEVFKRLRELVPNFQVEHQSFGIQHTGRRNTELHSGDSAFDGLKAAIWQPAFYETCSILLASMGKSLPEFVGADEAKAAEALISAARDESAKAVQGDVAAFLAEWISKDEAERDTLKAQAELWASRHRGHRVVCPACNSTAIVRGAPVSASRIELKDELLYERQDYLPTQFECVACGLKINNLSRLAVVGLADRYTQTWVHDPAEYYAPDDEWAGYEPDNNEP